MTALRPLGLAIACCLIGMTGNAFADDSSDARPAPPRAGAADTGGAQPGFERVRVANGRKGAWDSLVILLGIEQGLFQAEHLTVDLQWAASGNEALRSVVDGTAEFSQANDIVAVIDAYAKGAPVRVVSAAMTGASDLYWYVRADRAAGSVADLAGRPMAYSQAGAPSHLVALALAEAAKIRPQFIATGDLAATRTLVMAGQIDAGWAAAPFNLDLVADKRIRIIGRGSDAPALADQTLRVNVSSAAYLAQHRDAARRFLKAYAAAITAIYADPARAIALYQSENKLTPDLAKQALDFYPKAALALPVKGLPLTLAQAVRYKTIDPSVSEDALKGMLDIVYDPEAPGQ
jgi:NitT/TauT family transport system substrate-binding protein